jgi:hypothetical protein
MKYFTTQYYRMIRPEGARKVAVPSGMRFKQKGPENHVSLDLREMSKDLYERYYAPPKPTKGETLED